MSRNVDELDEQQTRQALAKFFCSKQSPIEVDGLIDEVLKMLLPQCQVSIDSVGHKCLKLYEEEKAKMGHILRNLDGKISLSVDILRSGKRYKSGSEYLCLTAHFVDDNWELKRWILSFSLVGLEGNNSPQEIILKSLKDWGIEGRISTITMVNSNRSDETLEIVKDHIRGINKPQLNDQLFRVYCCADIVNLVVQDAYNAISEIVDQIGSVYSFKDAISTWNNRNQQLREALLLESMGQYSSPYIRACYDPPSKKGWSKVKRICELVDDIYDIVFPLFELGYPTASIFVHHLQELKSYLVQKCTTKDGFIKNVAVKMLERLSKYMKDMNLLLAIASVMDPRFKMTYIKFSSSKFEGSEGNLQVSIVLEAVSKLYDEYVICFPIREKIASDSTAELGEKSPNKVFSNWDKDCIGLELLQEYKQFVNSTNEAPKSELERYLEEPVLPWRQDFNALSWWKDASSKYPTLSWMARDFLAIPISMAISDEALYTKQRKADRCIISFEPDLMNAFMCIRSWFLKN